MDSVSKHVATIAWTFNGLAMRSDNFPNKRFTFFIM